MTPTKQRVYYAQNREDLIIESFFPHVAKGFYVDIGAFDPDMHSVTKRFYERGWRGINIEPQRDKYQLFIKRRRRDHNVCAAISDASGTAELYVFDNQGLTTLNKDIKQKLESKHHTSQKRKVETKTLQQVFIDKHVEAIHFMKVDAEGHEYEILSSNDWKRFRPQLLCIESDHIAKDWHPLLKENGYKAVFHDGLNEYFIDSKQSALPFEFIDHVLLELHGGLAAEDFDRIIMLEKSNARYAALVERYQEQVDHLTAQLADKEKQNGSRAKRIVKKILP